MYSTEQMRPLFELIKKFEGCILTTYLDAVGVPTIGYGSTGMDVVPGLTWTHEEAEERMIEDAMKFARKVYRDCPDLGVNAVCALASFSYNVGIGAYLSSTLRRKIKAGAMHSASGREELRVQMLRWNKAGGRILNGLTRRRAVEAELLLRPD